MIKILLCAEGVTDTGRSDLWHSGGEQTEGWLQGIIRHLIDDVSFGVKHRRELLLLPGKRRRKPLPKGHGAKALLAKIVGSNEGFDLVVFMVDADGTSKADWRAKRTEINSGFAEEKGIAARGVACVPKTTSESWLLSDPGAWRQCGLKDLRSLPAHPEDRWGRRNDPGGNHPHQEFARLCRSAAISDSAETRVRLAEATSIATLKRKCPVSFGAFQSDLLS